MTKSFLRVLTSLFFAISLVFLLGLSEVFAYSTKADTQGIILYVKPGANGTCTSWADACELQTALTNSVAGDQIWVATGTYKPTTSTNREATFQLKSDVSIYGGFPASGGGLANRDWVTYTTTLSGDIGVLGNTGDNSYHVVTGSGVGATAILDGFTISGGNANGNNWETDGSGGGMYNSGGSPSLSNVTFSGNLSWQRGGGMYNSGSNPTLINVTFHSNTTTYLGGGMSNTFSIPTLTNVTFSGNTASDGGGIYNDRSSPTLTNVTFFANIATYRGGGMHNSSCSSTLTNVTFFANIATYQGGGMYNSGSNPTLINAILWGNTPHQIYNDGDSALVTFSDIQGGYPGTGNINSDPFLGPLTDNGGFTQTHALGEGSPTIDAGNPDICPAMDQRTYTRPIDGNGDGTAICDMGAYEYSSYPKVFSLNVDVVGNGSVTIVPEKVEYLWGEVVTLTATADPEWIFTGWSGDASRTENSLTVTIGGDINFTANFIFNELELNISLTPGGFGSVDINPLKAIYQYGDEVTLTATAIPEWSFSGWSGDASGAENPLYLTIRGNTGIIANFTQDEYSLDMVINPFGMGSISVDPMQDTYHYGDVVTLTAEPEEGWAFTSWGGDASGTNVVFTLTVQGNHIITANFINPQADILYVIRGTNGSCTSWADACELQTALFNAVEGNQIWVGAGTYKPTTSSDRTKTFQLKSGVAIYGGFPADGGGMGERNWASNFTTLSGDIGLFGNNADNSYHVVTGSGLDESAILDGFTISGGNADSSAPEPQGGGLNNYESSPTLTNVTFSGNAATYGGGISNENCSPTLTNVIINNNNGGGIFNDNSSPSLNNVTFHNNSGTGMYNIEGSNPTLTEVTFTENTASDSGGGMVNYASSPILTNVTFSGNTASAGGGMANYASNPILTNVTFSGNTVSGSGGGMVNINNSPILTNVTFSGNTASNGGGMYSSSSTPTLTNVSFSGNTASAGGGIYNEYSSSTLANVTFSGNMATSSGGGMYNKYLSPTLTNVTFSGNTAKTGGGMYSSSSTPTLTNVTFSGNTATNVGGGLYNNYSSPTLTNVTFSRNAASDSCGGMYNSGSSPILTNITFYSNTAPSKGGGMCNYGGSPILTNAILWGNTPNQISNASSSLSISYSDIQGGYTGTGNIDAIPLLGTLADNGGFTLTHALAADSPAIDTGNPSICPVIDQRTFTRPVDGDGDAITGCDMGAYEYASTPAVFSLIVNVVGNGSVTVDPEKAEYLWGEEVTLTPVADPDWIFTGWSGDASGMNDPLVVTINDNTNITANFVYYYSSLTVTVAPVDSGSVTVDPDLPTYTYGSQVTLNATSAPGWVFSGWAGDALGSENPLTITMQSDTDIFANFVQAEYTLTVATFPAGFGSVTIDPAQATYHYGDQVILTAVGGADHNFYDWSGDATGSLNPLTVTITGNMSITANFSCSLDLIVTPTGSGSVTVNPNQPTYRCGTVTSLTALANPGWSFIGWTGDASGSSNPINLTLNDNLDITANFAQIEYSLSVSVNPPGMGTVTKSPNKPYYNYGDVVTLTASGITGWRFTGWSGNATGVTNPLQVTITGNTNITANFSNQYTLSTIVDPSVSGTITRDINQDTYTYGTQVVLTANPNPGWTFAGWGGDASGSDNPLTITIIEDTSITATFTQDDYTLSVTPIGSGTVAVDPVQPTYNYGDVVTLTPTADPGWTFFEWGGDASGSDNPLTYTIIGDTNIIATFTQNEYMLTVTPIGSGSVAIDPVQDTYHYGDVISLTPTAEAGWTFAGWGDDASGSDNPLTYTIVGDTSITATFTQDEYTLTVTPVGSGSVVVDPDQTTYHYGDIITLTPSADPGWTFAGWGGDASGSDNPLTYTISGDTSITATFTQDEYSLTVTPIGSGMVTIDPVQATYQYGDVVTLTPAADPGWTFAGWGGDASGSDNPLTVTITGNTSIIVTFTQIEYTLAVDIIPVESGTVIISPMQTTYHYGDEVSLTPAANPGWTFSEWGGDATGSDNPLTVTIFGDTNITANFTQDLYTLDVTIEGSGSVAIDPVQATYTYRTEVTLTATADPSWSFAGWGGDASGSDNPLTFTIQGNTSITALFTTNWIFLPMITR